MNKVMKVLGVLFVGVAIFSANTQKVQAANLEVSGWLPYWRSASSTLDASAHLSQLTEVNPFGYTIKQDGTLFDAMGVTTTPWSTFVAQAKAQKVRVIPTVMSHDGALIDRILRDPTLRTQHINAIYDAVMQNGFDGVDIDYEGKFAETRPYFSLFLKELYKKMGKKWVMCTIEARTPLTSRYDTIPPGIEYANDFVEINKYCDRVRFMAYDQGSIDIRLNAAKVGPYIPVADTKWVEKTITLAAKDIKKSKIMIGVATYGYEYTVTPLTMGYRYDRQWSFNPKYAYEIAGRLGISPVRNQAGELSFSYNPATLPPTVIANVNTEASTTSATAAAPETLYSSTVKSIQPASSAQPFNILWWSDAQAIKEKMTLAKKLGVRGISIFKIDGGEDPAIWTALPRLR